MAGLGSPTALLLLAAALSLFGKPGGNFIEDWFLWVHEKKGGLAVGYSLNLSLLNNYLIVDNSAG